MFAERPYVDTTEEENETIRTEDIVIPSKIFSSEKQNKEIDEDEIKASIKTYIDSHEDLDYASSLFQEMIYDEEEFNEMELEKLTKIVELTKENGVNFSNYIVNKTLPEDYQKVAQKISEYITNYNQLLYELDEMFSTLMDDAEKGKFPKINIKSLVGKFSVVNGRKQKKIEEFLDKKDIKTKAFGRE